MMRSTEEELARMREVNLTLRRQLERARRDALLYAAQFCEDHIEQDGGDGRSLKPVRMADGFRHTGQLYAAKLREIAG